MDVKPEILATHPVIAAIAGAFLGLRAWPGSTWAQKASNLGLGFVFAIFVGPAAAEWLGVTSPRISAAIVFGCGAAGLVAFAAVIDGIKETKFVEIITGWLSRRG